MNLNAPTVFTYIFSIFAWFNQSTSHSTALAAQMKKSVVSGRESKPNAVEKNISGISFNEDYIKHTREIDYDLDNIDAMFERTFASLPEEVKVFPTENYYYFKYFANEGEIWGNFRLDSLDRDIGIFSFAYFFVSPNRGEPYYDSDRSWHKNFSLKDGVVIKKIESLAYDVSYKDKTVRFNLNDIPQQLPQHFTLRNGERLAARICDESGFQFILVFNEDLNSFYYILDDSIPLPDQLLPYGRDIFVGQLSEFAFYREPDTKRFLLYGVRDANIRRNNYFDGPFDQLADNFVNPDIFEDLIVRAYPSIKGRVRGRGDFIDANGKRMNSRISISPYISYTDMKQLWVHFVNCQSYAGAKLGQCLARERSAHPLQSSGGSQMSRRGNPSERIVDRTF